MENVSTIMGNIITQKRRKGMNNNCSVNNIYKLDGRVPVLKAVPFGLQHILTYFITFCFNV